MDVSSHRSRLLMSSCFPNALMITQQARSPGGPATEAGSNHILNRHNHKSSSTGIEKNGDGLEQPIDVYLLEEWWTAWLEKGAAGQ